MRQVCVATESVAYANLARLEASVRSLSGRTVCEGPSSRRTQESGVLAQVHAVLLPNEAMRTVKP